MLLNKFLFKSSSHNNTNCITRFSGRGDNEYDEDEGFELNIIHILSETLSINIGQVIVGVGLPFIRLEFGNHIKTVMGVVAVITR